MKRITTVVFASLVGLSLFAACGEGGAHQSRNRGDIRVEVPGAEEPTRSASYDFGEVLAGKSTRVTLRLVNVGPDGVTVTSTRFENAPTGAFFAQPPSIIEGNGEGELTVTFSPPGAGEYAGNLVIEHNGQSLSTSVSLSGKGL